MAYQVPPRFGHGDRTASAANLNKYSDSLNALYAASGGVHSAIGKAELPPTPVVLYPPLSFLNVWRWLWYMSKTGETATISDPAGVGDDVTLTDSDSAMAVYDLSGVSWLVTGGVYNLTGCQYACEDWEA